MEDIRRGWVDEVVRCRGRVFLSRMSLIIKEGDFRNQEIEM